MTINFLIKKNTSSKDSVIKLCPLRLRRGHTFSAYDIVAMSEHLRLRLNKQYEPSALVSMKYKGRDLMFKTDDAGNPVLLFIGRKDQTGTVKGERYVRILKKGPHGEAIKDHWELKGKAA